MTIILLFFSSNALAQLAGIKTMPGSYTSISAAVADLNAVGVGAGGVTFNIAAASDFGKQFQ